MDSSILRSILSVILVALTTALVAYPRRMELSYSPIQSLDAVEPLALFASLYYAWMAVLTVLICLKKRANQWQGLALVGIFVVVYSGFWDIPFAAIKHQDSVLNATTAEYIRIVGTIPVGHPNIIYTDFPGLHTLTAILGTSASLATPNAVAAMMLFMDLLRAGTLYVISLRLLDDSRWAAIAALLAMQGSIVFGRLPFYPGTLGLVFVSLFLLMTLREHQGMFARQADIMLAVALLAATTVTHFVTSALLVFLMLGMWFVNQMRNGVKEPSHNSRFLAYIYAVIITTWLIYAAALTFASLVLISAEIPNNLRWGQFLREVFIIGRSNFGVQVPPWATMLKLFWLCVLFGVGTIIALSWLRRLKSLRAVEARALGSLLGILLLSIIATLFSTAGSQFLRYPMYAPLITAPFLLVAIGHLSKSLRRASMGALLASLLVLAVPTFFVHYPTVRMDMFYPYELAPAQTLSRISSSAELRLIAPAVGYVPYVLYLPNAEYASTPVQYDLKDAAGVWAHLDNLVDGFLNPTDEQVNIYVLSDRPKVFYGYNFGIIPDDPHWATVQTRLEGQPTIYDNGLVTLHQSIAPVGNSGRGTGR